MAKNQKPIVTAEKPIKKKPVKRNEPNMDRFAIRHFNSLTFFKRFNRLFGREINSNIAVK